jgi:prolipoprotein diacylglyceryltransferase
MLKLFLKFTAIVWIAKTLKPRWKGLLFLFGSILAMLVAHNEYLSYVVITEDHAYLKASYWLKYTSVLLALLIYVMFQELPLRRSKALTEANDNMLRNLDIKEVADGFDFLREKKQLKTHGEQLLDKPEASRISRAQT